MTPDKAGRLVGGYDWRTPTFFRVFMPYLIWRVEVPGRKQAFIPLNRDYVPLGTSRGDGHVNYKDPAVIARHAVYFARDPAKLKDVWWSSDKDGGRLWLYDDSTASRVDYFARLERLMSRQMEMVG